MGGGELWNFRTGAAMPLHRARVGTHSYIGYVQGGVVSSSLNPRLPAPESMCVCVNVMYMFFFVPDAQGVIECTRENTGKLKEPLCTAQVHSVTEQTRGPCSMLA